MRSNRDETIQQHFQGYEALIKRVEDLIEQSERRHESKRTPFLNPSERAAIKRYLGNRCQFCFDGGYPEAVLQRLIINGSDESEIDCLVATTSNSFVKLTHRDVLGALMGLGVRREQFGDLWIDGEMIVIYAIRDIVPYIVANLTQINRLNVAFAVAKTHYLPNIQIRHFNKTVSSLRLDCVTAALCGLSRTRAQALIRQKCVAVNHETLEEIDYLCNNGDTISVRGHGRFVVFEVLKTTKKERFLLHLGKHE